MKKILLTLFASISLISFGQAPQEISYQGVARNTSGSVLPNQNIGIKLDLHQGSAAGTVIFSETHNKTTNAFGLFTLGIGSSNTSGFTSINWANGPYFLEVSMDPAGGTSYTSVGTQQFMSVPYALYAQTAGNASFTPTITINAPNTVTSSSGSYSINVPASASYTAGNGINISGNVISNTAQDQTVTITPAGSASVTGVYPNFTITTPTTQVYSAGNGISISTAGVISNTAIPVTPTLSVSGNSISINPGNSQSLPIYSLTQSASNIDLTQNGTSIATVTLTAATSTSLSAGNSNILLNQSGNAYTITPVTPIFTNTGPTTITGAYPNYTVNSVTSPTTTLVQGNNVTLNQSGSSYTVSVPSPSFATNGPTSISGTYPNYTVNSVASPSTSLVAGNTNIQLIPGTNSYTLNAYTYSLTNNSNTLTLTNGAPSGYTSSVVVPVGPTYTAGSGISITSGTITNTSPGITPTVTGTGNAFVTPSGSSFTVNVPTQTLTVSGNSVITSNLGGSATITPASLTYSSATNTIKLTDGLSSNSYTLNNYTAGTGISISGSAPNFVITNTAVVTTPTITGTGLAVVSPTIGNNFIVNVPAPTYTASNGILSFGTNTVLVTPTLSLTGGTLMSGVPTNSVNLSSLSVWSNSVGVLYPTTLTNSVGVGTSGPLTDKMEISYSSSPTSTHLHLRQGGADAFSRIKFSNSVAPSKYWMSTVTSAAVDANSGYNFFYHNGTVGRNLFTVAGDGKVSVNPFSLSYPTLFEVNGGVELDSTIAVNGLTAVPPVSNVGAGKIYYDKAANKFMVSENNGPYKSLFGLSPWIQGTGIVTQGTLGDKVGIGTNTPNGALDVTSSLSGIPAIIVNSNSVTTTDGVRIVQAGSGNGLFSGIYNSSSPAKAIEAQTNGSGAAIGASNSGLGSAAIFAISTTSNTSDAVSILNAGTGNAISAINTNSTSGSAGYFRGNSVSTALITNNTASGNAFDVTANIGTAINANSGGSVATMISNSSGSGDGVQVFATSGRAINATNNSSVVPAVQIYNDGSAASLQATKYGATTGGNVARLENLSNSNAADVLFVNNSGTGSGAAVHAVVSNTNTGTAGLFDGNVITNGNVTIPATKNYKYATPKTDYNSISALSFNTEGTYNRTNISGGIYISDGTAGVQGNLYAGVNLPNGAVITGLDAYVLDNDGIAGHDIAYVQLWRQDGAVGSAYGNAVNLAQTPGTTVTSSVLVKLSTTTISNPTVDNSLYTYYVRVGSVQAAPNLMLFKVVITYTITNVD